MRRSELDSGHAQERIALHCMDRLDWMASQPPGIVDCVVNLTALQSRC